MNNGSTIHILSIHSTVVNSRDRLEVRTLRCGRNNPGSNPGHGTLFLSLFIANLYHY